MAVASISEGDRLIISRLVIGMRKAAACGLYQLPVACSRAGGGVHGHGLGSVADMEGRANQGASIPLVLFQASSYIPSPLCSLHLLRESKLLLFLGVSFKDLPFVLWQLLDYA